MWNWLLSGLASQATLVMYDGDPMLEGGFILWRMAEQEQVTHFGTSAAFLGASEKQGVMPKERYALSALRAILSTGSTLYPSQFDYIMNAIKPLWIQSISGGTDIIGCFGLGCPLKPVRRGEVARGERGAHGVRVEHTPAGRDRVGARVDHPRRERQVCGDDDVAGGDARRDVLVGLVAAVRDDDEPNAGAARH